LFTTEVKVIVQQITSSDFDQKILSEQIKILYRSKLMIIYISLLVSVLLVYPLWDLIEQRYLLGWLFLVVILVILRTASYISYKRNYTPERVKRYALQFTLGSAGSGLLWGVAGVLFFTEQSSEHQFYMMIIFTGMAAASLASLHTYLPVFYAFLIPALIPIALIHLVQGDALHISLGIIILAFLIGVSYFGFNFNHSLLQTLRLRFENVELVEQLREQKEEAERANIAKSKFLAAASHDLRQPLHALMLFTSVLDETIQYPKVRKVVDQINASVEALQSLFNALLDISRLEAGVLVAEPVHFNLQQLLDKLTNDYGLVVKDKGLDLTLKPCALVVYSDPALLEQIMRNFVTNAIRYTNTGSITISCHEQNDVIRIDVSDTGVGIPADKQHAIFTEFFQLGNPQRDRSKGLGLGLAIVERIAKLLNHPIDVHSVPDQGSTFSISVAKGDAAAIQKKQVQFVAAHQATFDDLLIVVVDDESSIREGMQILLESWGCRVVVTATLDETVKDLTTRQLTPDGIIADFRLAGTQTGIHVIQQLHAEYGDHLPALIVTGDIEVDRLREVSESGFQLLHKPVAAAKLRAFVNNVMKNKKRRETF